MRLSWTKTYIFCKTASHSAVVMNNAIPPNKRLQTDFMFCSTAHEAAEARRYTNVELGDTFGA